MMMNVCLVFPFDKLHVLKFQNGANKDDSTSVNENDQPIMFLICESVIRMTSHQPSSPKHDGLDEVNEAILLALSDEPFSSVPSVRQIARRICVPKSCINCISSACRFSAFHSQTSDIFIGFLTSSPTVSSRKASQLQSNRVVDPTWQSPVLHPPSRIGWGNMLHISPWRVRIIVLLVNRSDHEMIWVPDGDEVVRSAKNVSPIGWPFSSLRKFPQWLRSALWIRKLRLWQSWHLVRRSHVRPRIPDFLKLDNSKARTSSVKFFRGFRGFGWITQIWTSGIRPVDSFCAGKGFLFAAWTVYDQILCSTNAEFSRAGQAIKVDDFCGTENRCSVYMSVKRLRIVWRIPAIAPTKSHFVPVSEPCRLAADHQPIANQSSKFSPSWNDYVWDSQSWQQWPIKKREMMLRISQYAEVKSKPCSNFSTMSSLDDDRHGFWGRHLSPWRNQPMHWNWKCQSQSAIRREISSSVDRWSPSCCPTNTFNWVRPSSDL